MDQAHHFEERRHEDFHASERISAGGSSADFCDPPPPQQNVIEISPGVKISLLSQRSQFPSQQPACQGYDVQEMRAHARLVKREHHGVGDGGGTRLNTQYATETPSA